MPHLHMHRPGGYGGSTNYYEADKEVVRGPYDSYSSEYRVEESADPRYSVGPYGERVSEVMSYEGNPGGYYGPHHRHHGGAAEFVERKEEAVYENGYDPYRRRY